jgi:hypothetical protein
MASAITVHASRLHNQEVVLVTEHFLYHLPLNIQNWKEFVLGIALEQQKSY